MWQLRLTVVLTLGQVLLAAFLLLHSNGRGPEARKFDTVYVSTPVLVCEGINAPALVFKLLGILFPEKIDQPPRELLPGLTPVTLFFLVGVAVLWFSVGRALENRGPFTRPLAARTISSKLLFVLLVLWGCILLRQGLDVFQSLGTWNNRVGNIAEGFLFFVWSGILIVIPSLGLVRGFRKSGHTSKAQLPNVL